MVHCQSHPIDRSVQKRKQSKNCEHTLSSSREKPRPALARRLCLTVGHRTIGRRRSTGRGATAAALALRASRRLTLAPGYRFHHVRKTGFFGFAKCVCPPRRDILSLTGVRIRDFFGSSYLIEVASNPTLPVLSEICIPRVRPSITTKKPFILLDVSQYCG